MKKYIIAFGLVCLFCSNLFGEQISYECKKSIAGMKVSYKQLAKEVTIGSSYSIDIAKSVWKGFCYDTIVTDCSESMLDTFIDSVENSFDKKVYIDIFDWCKSEVYKKNKK